MKISKICIGTKNPVKIEALKEIAKIYPLIAGASISSLDVSSQVSPQPKTLEETIRGAKERAKAAFSGCDLSFGIEDGLIEIPQTISGFMNVCVCAVYDSEKFYLGFSSAFEYPEKITKMLFREGLDVNQAFYELGLTKNKKIGSFEGAVSVLTKGRWKRSDTVKQAITSALVILENRDLYLKS
jgi:inosine/xanthosine triphosphatase